MKPYKRSERVGGLIQKTLSDILRKDIKDPRLDMIMITNVRVSQDLRHAQIYFSAWGGPENKEAAHEGFKKAHGFVKRALARKLGLRYMPELKFFYDTSFDYGSKIDTILTTISTENGSNNTPFEKE